ncbi:MAG: fibronectin type III domain-containing protein [Patescibacteria group bacterium]
MLSKYIYYYKEKKQGISDKKMTLIKRCEEKNCNDHRSKWENFVCNIKCKLLSLKEFIIAVPIHLKYNTNKSFLEIGRRSENGTFYDSYSKHIKQQKYTIGSVVSTLLLSGIFISISIFTWTPAEKVLAAGGCTAATCTAPYAVAKSTPDDNVIYCVNETFTFAGYWTDGGGVCLNQQQASGNVSSDGGSNWSTMTTTGGLRTTALYQGCYNEGVGNGFSKTVTAAQAGSYKIQFYVQRDNAEIYPSGAKNVTVKAKPSGPTNASHSAITTSAITWTWDNMASEDGYQMHSAAHSNLSGNLAADTTSWQQTALDANTQYTVHPYVYATVDSGNCNNDGTAASAYTAIETPAGIIFGTVTTSAIDISATGSFTNLATASSGLYFAESVSATNSNWTQTNSWQKTGLTANTKYSFTAKARNGNSDETSATAASTKYTLASAPAGITFDTVTKNAISVSATGGLNNLDADSSGLYFAESVSATNSDWTQTNTWEKTSLTPNTQYSFTAKARNGDSEETSATAASTKYTLAANANVTGSLAQNGSTNNAIVFTNDAGFGVGGVQYYRYVFDKNATYTFNNSETQWTTGTKSLTPTSNGAWYLHVKAYNGDNVAASSGATQNLGPYNFDATGPTITNIISTVTTTSATITWTTSEASTTQVAWGLTSVYGNTTTENSTLTTSHTITISGLASNQTFHFKPISKDALANQSSAADQTFATSQLEATVITEVQVTSITETSATVTWTTNHAADSKVRYGITTDYGSEVYDSASATSHSILLTGLTAGITYHYEVISVGNTTTYDADATFTTDEETTITDVEVSDITASEAVISWTTNHAADSTVYYGLTASYGSEENDSELSTDHSATLSGLTADTTYHYQVESTGNTTASSTDDTFTTTEEEEENTEGIIGPSGITVDEQNAKEDLTYAKIVTTKQTFVITGEAEPKADIKVEIYSPDYLVYYTTSDSDGQWSVAVVDPVSRGEHEVYVTVTKDGVSATKTKVAEFTISSENYLAIPTVFSPTEDGWMIDTTPTITGLSRSGNTIRFYIDDELIGTTTATTHSSGTGSFTFTLTSELSYGEHTLSIEAVDNGNFSSRSAGLTFYIGLPTIGPTLYSITTGSAMLNGIGWGDTDVRVYANGSEIGIFYISGEGVQNFSYRLPSLSDGAYTITAQAEDSRDKLSRMSNAVYYTQNRGTFFRQVAVSSDGTYVVRGGDSLWSITRQVYGDGRLYNLIIEANKATYAMLTANPSVIQVGWRLTIP